MMPATWPKLPSSEAPSNENTSTTSLTITNLFWPHYFSVIDIISNSDTLLHQSVAGYAAPSEVLNHRPLGFQACYRPDFSDTPDAAHVTVGRRNTIHGSS
jgi:hypothetical protein